MKNLKITTITTIPQEEWLLVAQQCPYATFFHTPYWVSLFYKNLENTGKRILFSDGVSVVLPIVPQRAAKGLLQVYMSMPASTFGGWLSEVSITDEHYELLIDYLTSFKDLLWRENPYDPQLNRFSLPASKEDFTYSINLEQGYDHVFQISDYCHKKALKNAQKSGIQIFSTEESTEWEQYYHIYEKSVERWKSKLLHSGVYYYKDFILNIKNLDPSLRKLWVAKLNDQIISGILCFYWGKHTVAWHGAGLQEFFNHRPNNLLYATAIEDAANRNFSWFDCNPSSGLEGVAKFKLYLGAQKLRSRVVQKMSPMRAAILKFRSLFHG